MSRSSRRVYDAVHRALEAGAHVVLASGRSPHGMTRIADLLDLRGQGEERVWVVASNGAVIFRYPPLEVVHEETFDARPAVQAILERQPTALVAVEERGVGYRVSGPFPEGELSGEMIQTDLDDLVGGPVSRVIIRDPEASADDFMALADELGLHGTNYVVGWTAWLDLSPWAWTRRPASSTCAASSASRRPTCWRSATAATTSRCSSGPAAGVAMGQAVQEVIDAADDVTVSVYEDGAAVVLEQYF